MKYDQIQFYIENSATVKIMRSDNPALVLSFFFHAFKKNNKTTIPYEELKLQLSQYIEHLPENIREMYSQKSPEYYLTTWTNENHRYLRRYYEQNNDIPLTELSYDAERALEWVHSLENKDFVGAKSRFMAIFENLKKLVDKNEQDPKSKIQELKDQKKQIDLEIKAIKENGLVETMDPTECRERFVHILEDARKLTSDFKLIEDIFKQLAQSVKTQQLKNMASKGQILGQVLDAYEALERSDQGKSFDAFWSFLNSSEQQEHFKEYTRKIQQIPEIIEFVQNNPTKGYEDTFFKLKQHLHFSGQKVLKSKYRLSDELRKLLHQSNLLENKYITSEINLVKKFAAENREHFENLSNQEDKEFIYLDYLAKVHLPAERPLWSPKNTGTLKNQNIAQGVNEDDHFVQEQHKLLFDQHYVNINILKNNLLQILQKNKQISLLELTKIYPITKGMDEILGYITLKDPRIKIHLMANSDIQNPMKEWLAFQSKWGQAKTSIPKIIFSLA